MADVIITSTAAVIPDLTTGGGGGGGAPTDALYWVGAADATLSAEIDLSGFTGIVKNTAGTPSAAVAGTDYQAPLTAGVDYQAPLVAGTNYEVPLTFSAPLSRAVNAVSLSPIANANVAAGAAIDHTKLANLAALSVLGNGTNGSAALAAISAATDGHVIRRSGTAVAFGTLAAGAFADSTITGARFAGFTDTVIPVANGSGQLVDSALTLSSGSLALAVSSSGGTPAVTVSNTSNTAGSKALIATQVAGTTADDAYYTATISGGQAWSFGLDNSDIDSYVIAGNSTLGTNNVFRAASTGVGGVYIQNIGATAKLTLNDSIGTQLQYSANVTMLMDASSITWTTAGATRLKITSTGNIVPGTAALATTATDGFIYMSTSAGAPTGVPTTQTGRVAFHYDTTNNQFYVYNAAWKKVALA